MLNRDKKKCYRSGEDDGLCTLNIGECNLSWPKHEWDSQFQKIRISQQTFFPFVGIDIVYHLWKLDHKWLVSTLCEILKSQVTFWLLNHFKIILCLQLCTNLYYVLSANHIKFLTSRRVRFVVIMYIQKLYFQIHRGRTISTFCKLCYIDVILWWHFTTSLCVIHVKKPLEMWF